MRHYRHERSKHTLCGLRIALDGKPRSRPIRGPKGEVVGRREVPTTDRRPRVLSRIVTWLPVPVNMSASEIPAWAECPHCLTEGRKEIEEARNRAATGCGPRRPVHDEKRWLADAHRAAAEEEEVES